ncbi:MAG: tRNA pseudouridine(54/55) synthase Pus10 [Thermoplasmata archaeon]|nr:tRNA pseudouridine(54/55) synthase Pus10 [Thermoplasmata archaeon]
MEDAVRKAAAKGLCDRCLGRAFGKAGHGMTNDERGRALLSWLAGTDGASSPSHAPSSCPVCGGAFADLDRLAAMVADALGDIELSTFLVGSRWDADVLAAERALWEEVGSAFGEEIRTEMNREVGKRVEALTGREADLRAPDVTAIIDVRYDSVELDVRAIFFYGRYRKLVRDIPQTRWPCRRCRGRGCDRCGGTGKMYATSVEEVVCGPLMAAAAGADHRFHGLGREDIDVRCLGNGRPFVAEVLSPRRRSVDLAAALGAVNATGLVELADLRPTGREMVQVVKDMRCEKTYECTILTSAPAAEIEAALDGLRGARIGQRTPQRVERRRADLVRERTVREVRLMSHDGAGRARVSVRAEAGTYIKELMHGDGGRTDPSLAGLLGSEVRVVELDVTAIHCDPLEERARPPDLPPPIRPFTGNRAA